MRSLYFWRRIPKQYVKRLYSTTAKTSTRHDFSALGDLPSDFIAPLPPLQHAPKAGPTTRQSIYDEIKKNMSDHPDSVILTEMGSFYELYFDQAVEFGPKLNLKLAKKTSSAEEAGFIYMSGFPSYQLDRYVKILVNDLKKTVTLVEQYELPEKRDGRQFERKVSRKITPGTLLNESFVDNQHSNYLLSIVFTNSHLDKDAVEDAPVGLAWLDLTVGEFYYQKSILKEISSDIARIKPKEILLDSSIKKYGLEKGEWFADLADLKRYHVTYCEFPGHQAFSALAPFENMKLEQYKVDHSGYREVSAMTAILAYLKENLPECDIQIKPPREEFSSKILKIDGRSMDALEIFESSQDSTKGSLFHTIRRTVSQSGTRLLSQWLAAPLVDVAGIEERQQWTQFFLDYGQIGREVSERIRYVDDVARLLQRISSSRRTDPGDLVAVANTIRQMEKILSTLTPLGEKKAIKSLVSGLREALSAARPIANKVEKSIDSDVLISQMESLENEDLETPGSKVKRSDGMDNLSIMKKGATPSLARLHKEYDSFDEEREKLWKSLLAENPDGTQLNLRWSPMYLYHVQVSLSKRGLTMADINIPGPILRQTKSRCSIQWQPWSELGTRREEINQRKKELEQALLKKIKKDVLKCSQQIRSAANFVDILDVAISFATLARENNLVRPNMSYSHESHIKGGRHLAVEWGLKSRGSNFTANDCSLAEKVWMITGPNMGGKSTFIRQIAIITVLAQIGSFTPASVAEMGIVDQIFCRVGAADDLSRDRSTFMVEMLETASILKNATSRSLAILDEVGRGTSYSDGLAIAYASIIHLATVNKCRTLFATHFGPELQKLLDSNNNSHHMEYFSVPWGDAKAKFRLEKGVSENSHGMDVAYMAGFPPEALKIARSVHIKLHDNK